MSSMKQRILKAFDDGALRKAQLSESFLRQIGVLRDAMLELDEKITRVEEEDERRHAVAEFLATKARPGLAINSAALPDELAAAVDAVAERLRLSN